MPRVFAGKVVIPGDQIEAYLQALTQAEKAREPFRRDLEGLKDECPADLATTYARKTVTRHRWIVEMFVEFLCRQTDVERIEEITRGMINTLLRR